MAKDGNTVVARVGLDDRGFQEGVTKIQRSLKVVQSEFSATSSKLGDFGKSTDGLKLKSETLNKQVELQKEKVAALNKVLQESVEKKGEDAKSTENLKIKLNYATAELNNMQRELKETTKELNVKSSAWYKLSQTMNSAGEKMKSVGDKMSSAGKKLSTAVTLPLVGIGTAATKMAMDAVESENLFEVAMGGVAEDARKWSEETSKSLGLNAYNVRNNMATYNAMLTSMGLTTDESLKMSEGLTQLSYDMASFYNLKPEEAFEKLKSGISGEAEPLKALGILVNDNTIKTYAYSNGIAKQGEQLTESQKVQARYGAILDATKNAQGDLARTMDSPTNKIRVMKDQAQQLAIQFGQLLLPILEKLIGVIKPLMDKFQGLSKEQQETIIKIGLVVAAVGPLLLIVGKVIGIVGALSSAIGKISGAMATARGATGFLGKAFTAITGPVGIAIMAITALISIFVALYKNNEDFRNSVNKVWNDVKNIIKVTVDLIKGIIKTAFDSIKGTISGIWNAIRGTTTAVWEDIKNAITNPINLAKNAVSRAIDAIKGFFSNLHLPEIKIPKIKLPHFTLKGEFSLNPPSVPHLGVNWYASGGIFNRPSVIGVGEAGTEAVLPIDKLDDLIAKAMEKVKGNTNGGGLTLNIENFINNKDKDIEQLAYELEFYRQRVAMGRGGD